MLSSPFACYLKTMDTFIKEIQQQGFSHSRQAQYQRFLESLAAEPENVIPQENRAEFLHVTSNSEFVQQQLCRNPQLWQAYLDGVLFKQGSRSDYAQGCQGLVASSESLEDFNTGIRKFRNQAMVGIIWRDFSRRSNMQQTTHELSWLAECCIQATLDFHYPRLTHKHGTPHNKCGEQQALLVIGMGKLGARELNLSSDIDLIFAYPDNGETDGEHKPLSNQEFFTRLGKVVIQSLDTVNAYGFVFRVDMRLRPFGQSGPLVSNFGALEDYYQTQGREWERYAMIKARVVASSLSSATVSAEATQNLDTLINQFTYRKYVDFSVVDALRQLKHKINQEVARRKLLMDVKLGAGGIREVEFIAQVFQLIRGGRDSELQNNSLLQVLPLLEALRCLPEGTAQLLTQAYVFLRNTEHAIQGYQDKQTQKLPDDEDQRLSIARVLGFTCWQDFYAELQQHQECVKKEFAAVIAAPDEKTQEQHRKCDWSCIWQDTLDTDNYIELLKQGGHEDAILSLEHLEDLRMSNSVCTMQPIGRQRLETFMPRLLDVLTQEARPTETLHRVLPLIKAVARRSAYLLLLIENPDALKQLVRLAGASPWIARELSTSPALLDELLDPRTLYHAPDKAELLDELRRSTLRISEDDLEEQMFALRYFRSAHALRVAACETAKILPLMKVSDYLSWLAETLLEYALQAAWQQMTEKHGFPDGDASGANFIIVGYGKLGGIELGHGSDLDLVFIHNAEPMGYTDGEQRGLKSLDNQTFYIRMGQSIIHLLDTRMPSGQLYEVDMRLRPSGNSGMLVSSLPSFERYQRKDAWTWEHQALVRARPVAGKLSLQQQFNDVRRSILCQQRELNTLRQDVLEMRNKMRSHLGSDKRDDGSESFNLKQDRGGIVDIEFMVQYAVLAWAHNVPALTQYTDNIRILESLEQSDLLSTQEVEKLTSAYKAFRSLGHERTLQQKSKLIKMDDLSPELQNARDQVADMWHNLFEHNIR
ncbi:glutamate-ammonia-ligase adenylyltransferase [Alteromonadaceae bacterium Bs31]|nr:glutamate-ammonia-ligase adenylyltransferase [Alteromonadaceae bacterium Bs31]